MSAVIDAGPLLVFTKLYQLHLLDILFERIYIPQHVHHSKVDHCYPLFSA